jgi:uncharacterized protein YpmB
LIEGEFVLTITTMNVGDIAYNQPTQISLSPESASQLLSFEGKVGEVIAVVANGNVDTVLSLNDPLGYEVAVDDDGGTGYNPEIVRYVIVADGTYILRVGTYDTTTSGSVIVTINSRGVNRLEDGAQDVTLNAKANSDVVTFEGVAGETVYITVTFNDGSASDISVTADQDSGNIMSYNSASGVPQRITLPIVVWEDGTVRVTISTSVGNGAFEVELGD